MSLILSLSLSLATEKSNSSSGPGSYKAYSAGVNLKVHFSGLVIITLDFDVIKVSSKLIRDSG